MDSTSVIIASLPTATVPPELRGAVSPEQLCRPPPAPGTFELGLCMAGAVSAGAYTAGVLDVLVEALDAWEAAKAADAQQGRRTVPDHRVVLHAMSGTSAGAMCGAMLAAVLDRDIPHVRSTTPADQACANPLYRTWVDAAKGVDLIELLETSDLDALQDGQGPYGLLNGAALERIAQAAFTTTGLPAAARRAWVAPTLHAAFTHTNLAGDVYRMPMVTGNGTSQLFRSHRSVARFAFGQAEGRFPDESAVAWPSNWTAAGWQRVCASALGSGSFPVALPPRQIARDPETSRDQILYLGGDNAGHRFARLTPVQASTGYVAVDGGCLNNEPVEICRTLLAGLAGRNPREALAANRATIVIDPFIDRPAGDGFTSLDPAKTSFLATFLRLFFDVLISDARANLRDIALATDETVRSRFLIAPIRSPAGPADEQESGAHLAGGCLGAFGGFLCEGFRRHDFLLGRRNGQRFLRQHLVLPAANPLFASWSRTALAQDPAFRVVDAKGGVWHPIIPVVGAAAAEEPLPDWPKGAFTPDLQRSLTDALTSRLDGLYPVLRGMLLGHKRIGIAANLGWMFGKKDLRNRIMAELLTGIRDWKL